MREDAYFASGLTQELIDALGAIKRIKVVSRFEVMPLRGQQFAVDDFGKRLNADYIIEGAVQRDKKTVKLTAHLHRVADKELRWSLKFDRPVVDVFAFETEISDSVAAAVWAFVTPDERRSIAQEDPGVDLV